MWSQKPKISVPFKTQVGFISKVSYFDGLRDGTVTTWVIKKIAGQVINFQFASLLHFNRTILKYMTILWKKIRPSISVR